jgi:quinol monooxygenase YgiN
MKVNAEASRGEPGCLRFELGRDKERPDWFSISEVYVDEAAVQAHYESPHFLEWRRQNAEHQFVLEKLAVRGPVIP